MTRECYNLVKGDGRAPPVRVWHDCVDIILMQDGKDSGNDTAAIMMVTKRQAEQIIDALKMALQALEATTD